MRRSCDNDFDEVLVNVEVLKKENITKEREIRRLMKESHQLQDTIEVLRSEISLFQYQTPDNSKKDAEVMVGMCLERTEDVVCPNYGAMLQHETEKCQQRMHKMEVNMKSSDDNVRTLRKVNAALYEEMNALRHVCAALDEQCHVIKVRAEFKDEIIREMRRQLRQAKTKLKKLGDSSPVLKEISDGEQKLRELTLSYGSLGSDCVRQQPKRMRAFTDAVSSGSPDSSPGQPDGPIHPESDECLPPLLDGAGDDGL